MSVLSEQSESRATFSLQAPTYAECFLVLIASRLVLMELDRGPGADGWQLIHADPPRADEKTGKAENTHHS
jgi:hypothetical protein